MLRLYYYPGNASLAPHMVLNELGLPHELVKVDRESDQHKSQEYLRLNPHGRIPALAHGEQVMYESAAICLYLTDLMPGRLAPPLEDARRPLLYQWLFFLTNTVQPALMNFHYPETVHEAPACREALRDHAQRWSTELFERLDRELMERPFLLGEQVSVCDLFLLMLCRWARTFSRPPRELPHLGVMLRRLLERPAIQETLVREGLEQPYI
jgi:glutathione S-transferase